MEYSAAENAVLVVVLAVAWFVFVKPIYKPKSAGEWRSVWFKTSFMIAIMYGMAWVMAFSSNNLFQQPRLASEALVMVIVIVCSLSIFAWLWQEIITEDKSVLSSAFEIFVSAILANMAVFDDMGELGGSAFKFLVFVLSIVIISKVIGLAKARWVDHLSYDIKRKWRWVAAFLVV